MIFLTNKVAGARSPSFGCVLRGRVEQSETSQIPCTAKQAAVSRILAGAALFVLGSDAGFVFKNAR